MKVLFVCSGNAYRSPVAEALLKKFNPQVEADSAGTNPVIPISELAKEYLTRENAVKHLKRAPEGLDAKNLREYDLIVAMEPKHQHVILKICPECEEKTVVWNIEDPYFMPKGYAEKVFQQIKRKVKELASLLQGQ